MQVVAPCCWQTLSSILNHLQGWGAAAEVAVVEVRCPVILACRQEDLLPFELPCTHVWTSSSLLSTLLQCRWCCAYAGFVRDATLTEFACALRDATVKDIGDNMQLLSFGPDTFFPDDSQRLRCDLLVRVFYPRLFDRIAAQPIGASLLTGVPGTGKSWWIWYAVHLLLKQDSAPAIVWQSFKRGITKCVLFKDGEAFVGHLDAFSEELGQMSTW